MYSHHAVPVEGKHLSGSKCNSHGLYWDTNSNSCLLVSTYQAQTVNFVDVNTAIFTATLYYRGDHSTPQVRNAEVQGSQAMRWSGLCVSLAGLQYLYLLI